MNCVRVRWLLPSLTLFALWVGGPVWADEVYSTLGPDDSWDQGNAYVVLGPQAHGTPRPYAPAMPFVPDFTAAFTSIELPIGISLDPGTNLLVVELRDDDNGLPGDVIESFVFEDLPYVFASDLPLSVAVSELQPTLEEGTTYWVAVFPGADDTSGGWNWSSPLQTGVFAASQDGGDTWTLNPFNRREISAFRVNGDPL